MIIDIEGGKIIIDESDFHAVKDRRIVIVNRGYFAVCIYSEGKYIGLARELTGCGKNERVVFKNGDYRDLRRKNMLIMSRSEFQALVNRTVERKNQSGYKGVYADPYGKYRAIICFRNKKRQVGIFSTPEKAHAAREKKGKMLLQKMKREAGL